MLLCDGNVNSTYYVKSLHLSEKLAKRLEALGITQGTPVSIMNKKGQGILIVKFRGSRFALGKNISRNIEVSTDR